MDRRSLLPAVACIFSTGCIQCTLIYLTVLSTHEPGLYYPLMLLPCSLAMYAANRLFLRRSRTMLAVALLNAGLCGLAFVSIILLDELPDWGSVFFAVLFLLWLAIRAESLAQTPPTLFPLILSVDLCLVLLALFTAYLSAFALSISWCAPIAAGCAASILGLIVYRAGSSLTIRSGLFLAGVFAGVFAMVWLLVAYLAAPAGEGLVTLWNWLITAVQFLLGLLWRLLVFLTSLLPQVAVEEEEWDLSLGQPPSQEEEELAQTNPLVLAIFLAIAAVLVLFLLIRLLRRLRQIRLSALSRPAAASRVRTGRISLLAGLRRLLAGLRQRLRLRLTLWQNRDNAWGLYFLLVRRSSPTPWHKLPGETPREFLTRLKSQAEKDPELTRALDSLIPAVDRALFAPDLPKTPLSQAPLIRRRLGRVMGRSVARQLLNKLPFPSKALNSHQL